MITKEDIVTLVNIGGGAAVEKFQVEHERVLKNIHDPNAKDGVRKVTLVVAYKHDPENHITAIDIDCKSSLQPPDTFKTAAVIGIAPGGKAEAREFQTQNNLDFEGQDNVENLEEHRG